MSGNSNTLPLTDSTNNIHLRKKSKRRFTLPQDEYRRVGFSTEELSKKTSEQLIKMEWMLEAPIYVDIPDSQKKNMLNDVINLYGDLKYSHFI